MGIAQAMTRIIVLEIGAVAVMHCCAVELGEDADGFQGSVCLVWYAAQI